MARTMPHWADASPRHRERAAWAAGAVGRRLLPDRPCLTQAIVLQYVLLRRGDDDAKLRLGVTRGDDATLQAHAWIERDGEILIGGAASPSAYVQFGDVEETL